MGNFIRLPSLPTPGSTHHLLAAFVGHKSIIFVMQPSLLSEDTHKEALLQIHFNKWSTHGHSLEELHPRVSQAVETCPPPNTNLCQSMQSQALKKQNQSTEGKNECKNSDVPICLLLGFLPNNAWS